MERAVQNIQPRTILLADTNLKSKDRKSYMSAFTEGQVSGGNYDVIGGYTGTIVEPITKKPRLEQKKRWKQGKGKGEHWRGDHTPVSAKITIQTPKPFKKKG